MAMLAVNDIHVYYGSIHAVKGVSLEVNEGEIVTLIGANGAGEVHGAQHHLRSPPPPGRVCDLYGAGSEGCAAP